MQVELSSEAKDNAISREIERISPPAGAGGLKVVGLNPS
jgi:hypothetical protein